MFEAVENSQTHLEPVVNTESASRRALVPRGKFVGFDSLFPCRPLPEPGTTLTTTVTVDECKVSEPSNTAWEGRRMITEDSVFVRNGSLAATEIYPPTSYKTVSNAV